MANTSAPMGLIPRRHVSGRPYNGAVRKYFVPASDATAIFIGDPVIKAGSADNDGIPTVTRATAAGGNRITGVMVGVYPDTYTSQNYRLASTATYIMVVDDPSVLFEAQEDAVGGAIAAASIGLNVDLIAGTGSTGTGRSGWMLDSSTVATTNTLQMSIVEVQQRVDNEFASAGSQYAKFLVRINQHTEGLGATGI